MMEYKGYIGKVEFDDQAAIFHGEVWVTEQLQDAVERFGSINAAGKKERNRVKLQERNGGDQPGINPEKPWTANPETPHRLHRGSMSPLHVYPTSKHPAWHLCRIISKATACRTRAAAIVYARHGCGLKVPCTISVTLADQNTE